MTPIEVSAQKNNELLRRISVLPVDPRARTLSATSAWDMRETRFGYIRIGDDHEHADADD
jgi:hypothetical protein